MSGADPVPAIAEPDATGAIAEIYADIRAVTGVGVVNLVWRRLATTPGALEFAWTALRPAYASGQTAAAGRSFRRRLNPPALPLLPKAALAAAGVDRLGLVNVRAILDSYDRTNAMNLIGLSALLLALDGESSGVPSTPAGVSEAPLPPIPPLPSLDVLDPSIRDLVDMLNDIGEEDGRVIASMYRHLAYWPGYLSLIWSLLAPLQADGRLAASIESARKLGRAEAAGLAASLRPEGKLSKAAHDDLREVLTLFVDHPIAKMSSICRALAMATPAP